jgi:hypothetical protein
MRRRRAGLGAKSRLEAGDERGLLAGREARFRMERQVDRQRHLALPQFLGRFVGILLWAVPLRDVEVLAPFLNVAVDQPGDRRDARIPGPLRLVAVTVGAGAEEKLAGVWRIPFRLRDDRRVGVVPAVGYQLDREENATQYGEDTEDSSAFHAPIFPPLCDEAVNEGSRLALGGANTDGGESCCSSPTAR